jgi:hypothetical protein
MHRKREVVGDDYPMEKFVKRFVAGETSLWAASWRENVGSWLAARYGQPDFLLVRYEDMISHTERELAKLATFLKIDPQPERIAQAVTRSCADHMRRLEKSSAHLWSTTKDTRKDVPFVRSAKPGGWRSVLSATAVAEIETAWGLLMRWLGYELSSDVNADVNGYNIYESLLGTR